MGFEYNTPPSSQAFQMPERKFIAGLDLQPCPFCGGPAHLAEVDLTQHSTSVECANDECAANGPYFFTVEEAVAGWNARSRWLAPGCCSAASPCSHQKLSPQTICATCSAARQLT